MVEPLADRLDVDADALLVWLSGAFDVTAHVAHSVYGIHVDPSTVQAWLRSIEHLAPRTRKLIFEHVSTVFAAVDDCLIARNPCRAGSVSRPKEPSKKVVSWEPSVVVSVRGELPARYQVVAMLCAGLGLRQGEAFGLSPDDVDWLRGTVRVRRQVKLIGYLQVSPRRSTGVSATCRCRHRSGSGWRLTWWTGRPGW